MPMNRLAVSVLCAAFLTTAAFAADTPPAQPGPPAWSGGHGRGPQGGPMGFLTAEQRLMHFADVQKATAGMSFDQARDYRMTERNKIMAMSAAERDKYAAELKARWDALPDARKAEIKQQAATYWNNRPKGGRGGNGW